MPGLLDELAATYRDKRLRIFFQDESRIGQKGRVCRRWFTRGKRPTGLIDQRYTFAYLYVAVEAETENAFALVVPEVNTHNMQVFIDKFAATIKPDEHVALLIDGAGWHSANDLVFPANITPIRLPPYAPEMNPIERVWEHLKERSAKQPSCSALRDIPSI